MLVDEAFEIYCECSEPGWDGYDALALSKEAFLNAKHFIDLIPDWVSRPDLVPSPDGWLSFEWRSHQNRILSITSENEVLIYAAMLSPQHVHYGRVSLKKDHDKLPPEITNMLSEYC